MTLKQEPPDYQTWFSHPSRETVKEESERIVYLDKAPKKEIERQMEYYKNQGFTDENGLYQNGFFIRHHEKDINKVCTTVYEITKKHSYRDQIALPFALYKTGYRFENVRPGKESHRYFNIWGHK